MSSLSPKESAVVKIAATGKHRVSYDLASFAVECDAQAQTSREAKKKLDEQVQPLLNFLAELEKKGVVAKKASTSNVGYAYKKVDREQVRDGFEAMYTLVFSTKQMEMVNDIFDDLTELSDEYTVSSPRYLIEDSAAAESEALKAAKDEVERQLNNQCALLGQEPNLYRVCWWEVGDPYAGFGKMTAQMNHDSSSDKLFAGKAVVTVVLIVGYKLA